MSQGTTTAPTTTGTATAAATPADSVRNYFTEQLLTILVCGLFGFAAVQMYRNDMLGFLAPQFRNPVLYGGLGVLLLVVLRAAAHTRFVAMARYSVCVDPDGQANAHPGPLLPKKELSTF